MTIDKNIDWDIIDEAANDDSLEFAETTFSGIEIPPSGEYVFKAVGYIETGEHLRSKYQSKEKELQNLATIILEVDAPESSYVTRISSKISYDNRAKLIKIFNAMNYDGKARNMMQIVRQGYQCKATFIRSDEIYDKKTESFIPNPKYKEGDAVYFNIDLDSIVRGDKVRVPVMDANGIPVKGEFRDVEMPVFEPTQPQRLFVWNAPSDAVQKAMWDTLYIDGMYEEKTDKEGKIIPAKSKNFWQNTIMEAANFVGSPIHRIVAGLGVTEEKAQPVLAEADAVKDVPERTTPPKTNTEIPVVDVNAFDDDVPF